MAFSPTRSAAASPFCELLREFEALCHETRRASHCADVQLCACSPGRRQSLENLHAYLALRSHDLSSLQERLGRLGLASLDQAEPHVLATLAAVLTNLRLLDGRTPEGNPPPPSSDEFTTGQHLLQENTARLFGPEPEGRRAHIMITLPDRAAEDQPLLESLLRAGMNCARINCAYGNQTAWLQTLQMLRAAESVTGRVCRVFMDLRGPKLRTGKMALEPSVLRVRPERAADGRVLQPARIWLTALTQPQAEKLSANASLVLVDTWLHQARPGDRIRLRDARGAKRTWRVTDVSARGCWAESDKTTYLVNGTALHLHHTKDQVAAKTTLDSLPPTPSRAAIRPGDLVCLTRDGALGKPPVHDLDGRLLRPATIPLNAPEVFRDARPGEAIGFDDGRITGLIEEADGDVLKVRIRHTRRALERLGSDKGINLPETALDLPSLSDEDLRDLEFVARNADIIGLSFTNSAADVRILKQKLRALGREDVGLIFKLETQRGCANLPEILLEAMSLPNFGVMIARGDLAAECGFQRLPEVQEDILRVCEAAHIPVVWATGVLEGLARQGHPVRAEMTDAAAAQRAECVMLGKGPYITRAADTLNDLLGRVRDREYKQQRKLGMLRLGS
jgi:pyruvate kinase